MTHTYNISGMTCTSCVAKVKSELLKLGDVSTAEVQLQSPQATITMQKHISTTALQAAIQNAGTKYTITDADVNMHHATADEAITKDSYYPIFLIFGYILAVVTIVESAGHHFDWMNWMNNFMAGFFLVFSFFKLLKISAFEEGYGTYDIIAKRVKAYGYIYPFIELGLGIALLLHLAPVITNIVTLIVMAVSTIGVAQSLLQKKQFQCACLGTVISLPLSKVTLFEDLLMTVMSGIMLIALLNG